MIARRARKGNTKPRKGVVGIVYTITSTGTTDFTLIGAANSDVGTTFTATGAGTGTGTGTPPPLTDKQKKDLFESERRDRNIETGRQATEIAAGNIPEGTIPTAEVEDISMEGTTASTVQMGETTKASATTLDRPEDEKVATMDATTGKTPEQIQAAQMTAAKITDSPDVQAALGELSDESLAKVEEIRTLSGPAVAAQISQQITDSAKAQKENRPVEDIISAGAFVPEVVGVGAQVSESPEAEKQTREAIETLQCKLLGLTHKDLL